MNGSIRVNQLLTPETWDEIYSSNQNNTNSKTKQNVKPNVPINKLISYKNKDNHRLFAALEPYFINIVEYLSIKDLTTIPIVCGIFYDWTSADSVKLFLSRYILKFTIHYFFFVRFGKAFA